MSATNPARIPPRLFNAGEYSLGSKVIAAAFYQDPLFRYWCRRPEPAFRKQQFAMAATLNSLQQPKSGYSLGVFDAEQLLGLAYLKDSQALSSMKGVLPMLRAIVSSCGFATAARFIRVGAELPRNWPQQRFLYLSTLAVVPDYQGRGYGRALLAAVDECARKHGYNTLCLDTQNPDNVDYYRRCGYKLHARFSIGRLQSWCMVKAL
jgi:ribosomal protein S18 acetylase RimI-like enzyme